MIIPNQIVEIVSKVAPVIGTALGSPAGALIGSLISTVVGVDMTKPEDLKKMVEDPVCIEKLKELDLQISDLQNARIEASKETGILKVVRPLMALIAMCAIFVDIWFIDRVLNDVVREILIVMLIFLVWDIRQIYKFYFGSGEDLPNFLSKK